MDTQAKEQVPDAATRIAGDRARAADWYSGEKLAPFGGRTAAELVVAGRAADVLRYLESIEAGPAG